MRNEQPLEFIAVVSVICRQYYVFFPGALLTRVIGSILFLIIFLCLAVCHEGNPRLTYWCLQTQESGSASTSHICARRVSSYRSVCPNRLIITLHNSLAAGNARHH